MVVLHEVEQAARRGNEQVAAALELLDLLLKAGAAHHDDGALARLLAHLLDHVVNLGGQLAGGRDHQRVRALARLARNALQRG